MDENSKKSEILKSATNCFLRYGFLKTTMTDIGKGASLNKASLYYYYKDKNDIFKDVVLNEYSQFNAQVLTKTLESKNYSEKILTIISESIKFNNTTCNTFQLSPEVFNILKDDTKEIFAYVKKMNTDMLINLINEGIKTNEFQECNTQEIGENIHLIIDSFLNVNCPLHADEKTRTEIYEKIEKNILFTVGLMLKGLSK